MKLRQQTHRQTLDLSCCFSCFEIAAIQNRPVAVQKENGYEYYDGLENAKRKFSLIPRPSPSPRAGAPE